MSDQDPSPGSFFIDYPTIVSDVAVGDLLCFNGKWRRVLDIMDTHGRDARECRIGGKIITEHERIEYYNLPLPRIAGPLLDALRNRDPYR